MTRIASRFAPEAPAPHTDGPAAEGGDPAPATVAGLVARCQQGERAAQRLLYLQHVQSVNALAVRLLGRSAEAEDVVQDTFVTAFTRIHQLREGALFRAWLLRIAVREVHRRFRRQRLLAALGLGRRAASEPDASLEQLAAPGLPAEARAELRLLDRVLTRLPARERVAWMLRHIEGLELTEVASACDTSLATIKRWLTRAEQQVQRHLREEPSHG